MLRILGVALATALLPACELLPPRPITIAETQTVMAGPFDRAQADALIAEAQVAADRGDAAAALAGYRAAGLAWPESEVAWQGLLDAAERLEDDDEQAAADFMLGRVRLYDGADLVVQREVNRALRLYLAEAEDAGTPATTRQYAQALSDYYTARLEASGLYEPPPEFLNVENRELPAAIGTGLAVGIYATVLGLSTTTN